MKRRKWKTREDYKDEARRAIKHDTLEALATSILKNGRTKKSHHAKASVLGEVQRSDRVRDGMGTPCPRCDAPTLKWVHGSNFIPPSDRGYYRYWFQCPNPRCATKVIMPPGAYAPSPQEKLRAEFQPPRLRDL